MKKSYIELAYAAEHGMEERSPMSWNHAQCYDCWTKKRINGELVRIPNHQPERCCFCKRGTIEGIFIRKDPKEMRWKHA